MSAESQDEHWVDQHGADCVRVKPASGTRSCACASTLAAYGLGQRASIPAVAFRSAVNIRKFVVRASRLPDLVELGPLTPAAAQFPESSVRAGLNVLVTGGTRPGSKRAC